MLYLDFFEARGSEWYTNLGKATFASLDITGYIDAPGCPGLQVHLAQCSCVLEETVVLGGRLPTQAIGFPRHSSKAESFISLLWLLHMQSPGWNDNDEMRK